MQSVTSQIIAGRTSDNLTFNAVVLKRLPYKEQPCIYMREGVDGEDQLLTDPAELRTDISLSESNLSQPNTPLHIATSVREVENQDGAVLLDLRQGICFGLTPVGIKIWHLLKENLTVDQIADRLSMEYSDVPMERIADDVGQYVTELRDRGLLIADQPAPSAGLMDKILAFAQSHCSIVHTISQSKANKAPHFVFWKALFGLLAFDLVRCGNNFCRSYEVVQRWKVAPLQPQTGIVDQVSKAVNYACVWYPKRVLCLQRSVITTCLLRHCGVPAQMAIGAQKYPFKAHAWTEVNGAPINECRDIHCYLVWERY